MSGGMVALLNKKREKEGRLRELRESFKKADKDGDGELSLEEWIDVMKENGVDMTRYSVRNKSLLISQNNQISSILSEHDQVYIRFFNYLYSSRKNWFFVWLLLAFLVVFC